MSIKIRFGSGGLDQWYCFISFIIDNNFSYIKSISNNDFGTFVNYFTSFYLNCFIPSSLECSNVIYYVCGVSCLNYTFFLKACGYAFLGGGGNVTNVTIYMAGLDLRNCVLMSDLALVQIGSSYYIDIFPNGLM